MWSLKHNVFFAFGSVAKTPVLSTLPKAKMWREKQQKDRAAEGEKGYLNIPQRSSYHWLVSRRITAVLYHTMYGRTRRSQFMPPLFPRMDLEAPDAWPSVYVVLLGVIAELLTPLVQPTIVVCAEERVYVTGESRNQAVRYSRIQMWRSVRWHHPRHRFQQRASSRRSSLCPS